MPDHRTREALRRSYDEVAEDYVVRLGDELSYKPLDRAILAMLADVAGPGAPCGDLGCGPGHVAGWLAGRGVRPVGIDLSPGMLAIARRAHPQIDFREGDLVSLPADDGAFAFVVALYSVIHLPPDDRPLAFTEIRRVLRPGGNALVAFHAGDEVRHVTEWWDHPVDVHGWFVPADRISAEMEVAGLSVDAMVERVNYPGEAPTRRAYLLAHRVD